MPSLSHLLVFNKPRPGTPKTATTEDNVIKVHDLVLADREIAEKAVDAMGVAFAYPG